MDALRRCRLTATTGLLLALSLPLSAADNAWTNAAATFGWNFVDANWTAPTIWANGDSAILGATGVGSITVAPGIITGSMNFTATGYTLNGGAIVLATGSGGTLPDFTIQVGPTSGTGTIASTISSTLITTGGLNKIGLGSLTLSSASNVLGVGSFPLAASGLSANVLIGSATSNAVLGGSIVLGNAAALPADASVAIGNGSLQIGSNTVTIADLVFTNTTTISTFTNAGVFAAAGGSFSVASNTINVIGNTAGRGNTIGANMTLPASLDLRIGSSGAANNELVLNNIITGPGGLTLSAGVTDTGTPSMGGITIRGANTYAGGFTLNAAGGPGVLVDVSSVGPANAPTSGAFGTGTLTIAAAGTIASATLGQTRTVANPVIVNSDFTIAGSAGLIFTGTVDLNPSPTPLVRAITANGPATFAGVVSNSGGSTTLQKLGTGTLTLSAANTYTGGTTLQAGILGLGNDSALGSESLTVTATSGLIAAGGPRTIANSIVFDQTAPVTLGLGANGNILPLTLSGPIDLNSSAGVRNITFSAFTGMTATLSGQLTHSGTAAGFTKAGNGLLVLSGANAFDGPTAVSAGTLALTGSNSGIGNTTVAAAGTLQFQGDGSFAGGTIGVTGTLQPLTSGTFTRPLISNGGMTVLTSAGLTPSFSGAITFGIGATFPFTKSGPGSLTLLSSDTSGVTGAVSVTGGELILGGPSGNLANALSYSVSGGARLTVNSLAGTIDRLNNTGGVTLNAGELLAIAANAGATAEQAGALNVSTGVNTVTGIVGGGTGLTLNFGGYTAPASASASVVYRGQNLGLPGGFNVKITTGAPPDGTFLIRALGDNDPSGSGSFLVEYSAANGVRQVTYTPGLLIQNAAPTLTPTNAHFQVTGSALTADAANTIASLTFSGTTADLNSASGALTLSTGQIVVQNPVGASDRSITGGTLLFGVGGTGSSATFSIQRDTTVSSAIVSDSGIVKNGPGRLTLSGNVSALSGPIAVNGGTIVFVNGASLTNLSGGGTIEIGTGSDLTLTSTANQAVGVTLTGAGGFRFTPGSVFTATLSGANSHGGGTVSGANGRLALRNPSALGTGPVTLLATTSSAFNAPLVGFDFGANSVSTLNNEMTLPTGAGLNNFFAINNSNANPNQSITLAGRLQGGNAGSVLAFDESGTSRSHLFRLTNATNSFLGTIRVVNGGLAITSDAVLGNVNNTLQLDSALPSAGSLRFDAPGITLPVTRAIGIGGSISFNTNGNDATILGPLSGSISFDKIGAGTLTIAHPTQPFTGAVLVRTGTLMLNGVLASSTNGVTVNAGATLAGTGTISRPVQIDPDGIVAPGSSPGILTVNGAITMNGSLHIEAGDTLNVLGSYSNSNTSGVVFQGAFNPVTTYDFVTFLSFNGTQFVNVFNLPPTHAIVYGANAISLVPVPEPVHALLVGAAAAGIWLRKRRATASRR